MGVGAPPAAPASAAHILQVSQCDQPQKKKKKEALRFAETGDALSWWRRRRRRRRRRLHPVLSQVPLEAREHWPTALAVQYVWLQADDVCLWVDTGVPRQQKHPHVANTPQFVCIQHDQGAAGKPQ
ncbi:uncharacterized protein EMH_0056150 [Eimeria mitis]|uniref:Uncharacterized protein n=1 Tax=Eimeria mitis TaxID=44415 RepID=U6JXK3_9EIME|nr:uncharacterized protein EMH_0056150 [Eimeria mitis]CDJ30215.1 hypothetical protein EMH_0056150 [Eimeria mitis]